jgi:hypothetical protein
LIEIFPCRKMAPSTRSSHQTHSSKPAKQGKGKKLVLFVCFVSIMLQEIICPACRGGHGSR